MQRSRLSRETRTLETGSASIEFIVAGSILLVPLVYLILALSSIQSGSYGVEGAARQAGRVYVRSSTAEQARALADVAIRSALDDYGVAPGEATVRITCRPHPDDCLSRRGWVTVRVMAVIPLPLSPPAPGGGAGVSVPVAATATQQVSRFSSLSVLVPDGIRIEVTVVARSVFS